jgi:hypothetical protein
MDADEELLLGRKSKRRWIAAAIALPFLIAIGGGVWFFLDQRRQAREKVLVEQVTAAAFGCVASVRGDAPEVWGLERALEHMSRMERVTRDADDPTTRAERERFARLASDAARGCEELGSLMMQARREAPDLYFGVPAPLAQPPDLERPQRWFRRVLPQSRPEVLELTRQIRTMADEINARRTERALMTQELPIEGRGPSELARIIELAPLPRDRERLRTEAWPMPDEVVVLRRGSIPQVPCETRYLNLLSCYHDYVQTVSWAGETSALRALERPEEVSYFGAFAPTPDGWLYAIGADARGRGVLARYAPGATVPEIARVAAPIDASTNVVAVAGGVAVFPSDGSAWLATGGGLELEQTSTTPPPIVLGPVGDDPERGIRIEGLGTLRIFGSDEGGWTSRFSPPDEDAEDVLQRMIDAHSRVEAIASLRSLRSGKAVAVLQRFREAPDAVALTTTFGRDWLAEAPRADGAAQ